MRMGFEFPVLGKVDICVHNKKFADFIRRQFVTYYYESSNSNQDGLIIVNNLKLINQLKKILSKELALSREFIIKNHVLIYKNVIYKIDNGKLSIQVLPCKNIKKRVINQICRFRLGEYGFFHNKFYYEVLFPIFSLYAMQGFCILHGALIQDINGRDIVLIGLDGVGKSSLSILFQQKKAKSFCDNFLLSDGYNFVPLNLSVRVDLDVPINDSYTEIFRNKKLREVSNFNNCRTLCKVEKVYIIYIAEKLFSTEKSISLINLINYSNGACEIRDANSYIAPFSLLASYSKDKCLCANYIGIPKGKLLDGLKEIEK